MAKERYIVIQEWMLDLGLNGSELLAYALIYGFSQDGESDFHGSASYLARWCGVSWRHAVRILKKLTDAGYVTKTKEVGFPDHYRITDAEDMTILHPCPNVIGDMTIGHTGYDKTAHDNKIDIKEDNKDIPPISTARAKDDKILYGENVLLTTDEHAKLVTRFGADDTARLVEILDGYLSNPKQRNRYANHYRAILGWPVQRLAEEKLTQQRLQNSQEAAQRVSAQQQTKQAEGPDYAAYYRSQARLQEILAKGKQS